MAESYLTLTNKVLARLNEVELTSSTFTSSRGIQTQAKTAINEAVRYINQREHNYPFNHATASQTLTAGVVRYSLPATTKVVDYNTFRIVKDSDLAVSGGQLSILNYNDYISRAVEQEDEINTTTTSTTHTDSVTTITVASTTDFDSAGTLFIGNEQISYTAIGSSTTFTGCTRGANSTTAASIASGVTVAQFDKGSVTASAISSTEVTTLCPLPPPPPTCLRRMCLPGFSSQIDSTCRTVSCCNSSIVNRSIDFTYAACKMFTA